MNLPPPNDPHPIGDWPYIGEHIACVYGDDCEVFDIRINHGHTDLIWVHSPTGDRVLIVSCGEPWKAAA